MLPSSNSSVNSKPKDIAIDSVKSNWTCEGNLTVRNNILPNLLLYVKGNLIVQGIVNGSEIVVEKDAWFEGGILANDKCKIIVHGQLKTRRIENATIECDNSIEVYDSIIDSFIRSKKAITVGKNICGGQVLAEHSIKSSSLGSPDKKETKIESGANFRLKIMQEEMNKEFAEISEKAEKIRSAVAQLENKERTHYSGLGFQEKKLLKSSNESMEILEKQLDGLSLRKSKFEKKLEKTLNAFVEVTDRIFPGTHLSIQNRFVLAQKEYPAGKYTIRDGKITRLA